MDFRNGEESKDSVPQNEKPKLEIDRVYFGCGNESEDSEFKNSNTQSKDGVVAPKPSDVKNGDLVSLLLAATPPYLYNIPLVPQTFFFSEMLKSFVQAKTERQNLKAQQSHQRRQRKRPWRETTPPKPYEVRDKPLELTTTKPVEDKGKPAEKPPAKKLSDSGDKKYQTSSELGNSNFTVEKLANSSIASSTDSNNASVNSGDVLPPAPPLWYPLLYPPHPPYGIDPLHFFIDLRVSAHFWDRKLASEKISNETAFAGPPFDHHAEEVPVPDRAPAPEMLIGRSRHDSAFRVPAPRREDLLPPAKDAAKKSSRNVHYVISSLKDIYRALDEKENGEREKAREEEEVEEKKCKDLRALIGLELVVDYVKQESDGEDEKSDISNQDSDLQAVCIEE